MVCESRAGGVAIRGRDARRVIVNMNVLNDSTSDLILGCVLVYV